MKVESKDGRKVFYVDVGDMPKEKVEQLIKKIRDEILARKALK